MNSCIFCDLVVLVANDRRRVEAEGVNTNRVSSMGVFIFNKPKTAHDIPTGIVTDRKSFDATPVFFSRVYCAICRSEHEWFAKEAWVCDAEVSPRASRPSRPTNCGSEW